MCGRYTLYDTQKLGERFKVKVPTDYPPSYNVAPSHNMPVITSEGLDTMRWGLIPKWAKDEKIGYSLINARSETVFDKPMWKGVIRRNRCLVPANGFYEWQKTADGKQPYYIRPKDQGLFAFAGVWETWSHEGNEWHTYSILTTEPNSDMKPIHDRMPVILYPETEDMWLGADTDDDITALLHPYGDGELEIYPVSTAVNMVKTNDASLIGPVNSK